MAFFQDDLTETPLDSVVFSDTRLPSTEFTINYFEDTSKVGTYVVAYKAFLVDYPAVELRAPNTFTVNVVDPCEPTILTVSAPPLPDPSATSPLSDQSYYISDVAIVYQVPEYVPNENWCVLTYSYSTDNTAINAALAFDATTRTFTVDYSADLSLSGST